jgi:sulfur carrier protein ThiS
MPRIEFTSQLAQHVDCPPDQRVEAETLKEILEKLFVQHPKLRDYVVDEQGMLRQHIALFIDGEMIGRSDSMEISLSDRSEVFVMQAISGG